MVHKYADGIQSKSLNSQGLYPVGIVGARGYSGIELARLLLSHPSAKLAACFATDPAAFSLSSELYSDAAAAVSTLPMSALDSPELAGSYHTIFLATPAEVSLELAPKLIAKGVNVVDLSGAFRLEAAQYPKWYGFTHSATAELSNAEYGLVPFAKPFAKKDGQGILVANPGCYVTSVLMGLLPLLKEGIVQTETIVIDAKSGTTGGGKKASEALLLSEVDGECLPYKIGGHQHYPEITKYAEKYTGVKISPFFSTSLLPTPRGIIAGIYATLAPGKSLDDVTMAFSNAYSGYGLAKFAPIGDKSKAKLLSLKQVVGTNRVQLAYTVDSSEGAPKLYLYSLIDNLLKGAASQAVENWNRIIDQPATQGLLENERR